MAIKFNAFTGNFDLTGSGGGASYIDGEEAVYGDLSLDAGVAPLNSAWLVRNSSGIWPFNKPGGIYIRTATAGVSRDADYTYAGTMPDVFSDAVLTIYDEASTTRTGQFNLGGVTAGQNRVLTWPDASGVIDIAATRTAATYSTDQALPATRNTQLVVGNSSAGSINLDLPTTNTNDGDIYTFIGGNVVGPIVIRRRVLSSPEIWTEQARITTEGQCHTFRAIGNGNNNWELVSANWAKPPAIGNITPNTGAFTTLAANNGTLTASAPVLDVSQTWNANVNFIGFRVSVTDTSSGAGALFAQFDNGNTSTGAIRFRKTAIIDCSGGNGGFSSGSTGFVTNNGGGITLNNAVTLFSSGANVFEQRRGGDDQIFRLYSTFTSTTSYQRMAVRSVKQTLSALSGASATTTGTLIPDGAVVVGVTTRVATLLAGAAGYTIGDGTDADRWGDITGTAVGTTSDNRDWTAGTIECFTAGGEITLTAKTSNFTAGAIEICVFYLAGEAD